MVSIDEAFGRLEMALSMLETAVTRRREAEDARGDRETELALMEEDRMRLAAELDAASERLARVTAATGTVGQRIDRAILAVESVLDRASQPART